MGFSDILAELPALTMAERQLPIRRAIELDEPELSPAEETLGCQRLADPRRDPGTAVPLHEMKARVRAHFPHELSGRVPNGDRAECRRGRSWV